MKIKFTEEDLRILKSAIKNYQYEVVHKITNIKAKKCSEILDKIYKILKQGRE